MEQLHTANESRKFFRKVNSIRKGYQSHITTCRNKEGELISVKGSILARWKEYMEDNRKASIPELAGESSSSTKDLDPDSDEQQPLPTLEVVTHNIKRLKNHRSPGSDNISSELIKEGGQDKMHKVMKEVWNTERMPKDWEEGIMCPIYKKGNKLKCENYTIKHCV